MRRLIDWLKFRHELVEDLDVAEGACDRLRAQLAFAEEERDQLVNENVAMLGRILELQDELEDAKDEAACALTEAGRWHDRADGVDELLRKLLDISEDVA